MGRRFAVALLFLGFHSAVGGCVYRNLPVEMGPKIPLGEVPARELAASMTVRMEDARPDWERKYYAGSQSPLQHEWGMTFWPMESFQPAFERHLETCVLKVCDGFSEQPTRISVKLTSFRSVLSQVESLRAEARRRDEHSGNRSDSDDEVGFSDPYSEHFQETRREPYDNFGKEIAASLMEAVLGAMFEHAISAMVQSISESPRLKAPVVFQLPEGKRLFVKPPEELRETYYGPGLTAEMEAQVTLSWENGRSETFRGSGWNHASEPAAGLNFGIEDVARSVRSAIRVLGYDLQEALAKKFEEEIAAGTTISYSVD